MCKNYKYTLNDFRNFLNSLPDDYRIKFRSCDPKLYAWRVPHRNFEYMRLFWLYLKLPRKTFQKRKQFLQSYDSIETTHPMSGEIITLSAKDRKTGDIVQYFGSSMMANIHYVPPNKRKKSIKAKDVKKMFIDSFKNEFLTEINFDDIDS